MAKEQSAKPFFFGVLLIILGIVLIWWSLQDVAKKANEEAAKDDEGEICIQVITPAKNSETGEVKDFPTPCDVPEGWEVVQSNVVE